MQFSGIEEDVDCILEAVRVEIVDVFPPLLPICVPNHDLPQSLLHNVLAFVPPLIFDLAGTVAPTRQTSNIILALSLGLKHVMGSKTDDFFLFCQEILHFE